MTLIRLSLICAPLLLAACASRPSERPRSGLAGEDHAEIGEVVAAELGFARTAQQEGQWTAFSQFATDEAVMFVPEAVNAKAWLKGRANPAQAVRWQPHEVWSSCDGSLAVARGAWQQADGTTGYFTTAWAHQRDGEYRWVLDQGDTLATPLSAPEFIGSKVADCAPRGPDDDARANRARARPVISPALCDAAACRGGGEAADRSLRYDYTVRPDGARAVTVSLLLGGAWQTVLKSDVAAAPRP